VAQTLLAQQAGGGPATPGLRGRVAARADHAEHGARRGRHQGGRSLRARGAIAALDQAADVGRGGRWGVDVVELAGLTPDASGSWQRPVVDVEVSDKAISTHLIHEDVSRPVMLAAGHEGISVRTHEYFFEYVAQG